MPGINEHHVQIVLIQESERVNDNAARRVGLSHEQ